MKQVLYFSAPWCNPCKAFRPSNGIFTIRNAYYFIDVDTSSQTAAQYNVRSIPTTIVVQNEMEIGRIVGVTSKENIRSLYKR
jgi:thioredoxin-like negative regulator of GroEL